MSEQYRDPYRRTPVRGAFFVNLVGDDALKQLELARVPAAPLAESPAVFVEPIADESSAPVTSESLSTATIEPEAIAESPVDASAAGPQSDASPEPPVETRP